MPMYEFQCPKCNLVFEDLVKNAKEKVPCPDCGHKKVERLLSRVAFSVGGTFTASTGSSECGSCSSSPSSCSGCSHG